MIADRQHDRRDHDRDVVGHADRGDHRVEREDDVEQHDLDDDRARTTARRAPAPWPSSPSSRSWISSVALPSRNRPPPIRMRSRPEMSLAERRVKSGAVEPDDPRDRHQQHDPHHHRGQQARRAARCLLIARGSLPDRIEMKMTLSTPRMISRKVSVTSASRPSEVRNASTAPTYHLFRPRLGQATPVRGQTGVRRGHVMSIHRRVVRRQNEGDRT